MSKSDIVRATRDGDQFHYLWAARKCLQLLAPNTDLVAIAIEGPALDEMPAGEKIDEGDEVIDVAEYYGDVDIASAAKIRYVQLKHSTLDSTKAWTMSGLKKTLKGFAKRYQDLAKTFPHIDVAAKVKFIFATNRPISIDVTNAFEDARSRGAPRDKQASEGLENYTGMKDEELAAFSALFHVEASYEGFLAQRQALSADIKGYLPGGDSEAFLSVKELVTRKATTEFQSNPTVTKIDLFRALGIDDDGLFPAKNLISRPEIVVPRTGEVEWVNGIVGARSRPVVVHAEGGIGKSVFAQRINLHLPSGSTAIVYDCFGNGEYRAPSHPRHSARQALVQIANELASSEYCAPLIPSGYADDTKYFQAFSKRVGQAITHIREREPDAVLCIVIDAADNAEMAAEATGESPSFARKLIHETFPDGVRLVMLCRTHRRHLLNPPSNYLDLQLPVFNRDETAAKLTGVYPDATSQDIDEFHRLSSQNPRVQGIALGGAADIQTMLRNLGPAPKTPEDMIGLLLEQAVNRARDEIPSGLQPNFERICMALALLRPMIPISVLSTLVKLENDHVRGFLAEFGQSILIKDTLVQFRDEPTETWFQSRFNPDEQALRDFISVLKPQAKTSTYVAAALPHLLLKAGHLDELIKVALDKSDLPEDSILDGRDVEAQRFQLALKASIRSRRYLDATKLALSAANLAAAEGRQWQTVRENTDLAGIFLEPDQILDAATRKELISGWHGSHHAYNATLLSYTKDFHGETQSHIRMAWEWIFNIQTLPEEERREEHISAADIAALALADLNVYGPRHAAATIARCKQLSFRYNVASIVMGRLADFARTDDISRLTVEGASDIILVAAAVTESVAIGHLLPAAAIAPAWEKLTKLSSRAAKPGANRTMDVPLTLASFAYMGAKLGICTPESAGKTVRRLLDLQSLKHLGYEHDTNGPSLIKAHVLTATLQGNILSQLDLAHSEIRESLSANAQHSQTAEVREFKAKTVALMPWYQLWADLACRTLPESEIAARFAQAEKESNKALSYPYSHKQRLLDDIAIAQTEVLLAMGEKASVHLVTLKEKLLKGNFYSTTIIKIIWLAARSELLRSMAMEMSARVLDQINAVQENAESRASSLIDLSRALLACHQEEAKHFFLKSLEVASKIGEENLRRWGAAVHLTDAAASTENPEPKLAQRFARAAELTYHFVDRDKHFDWVGTIKSLANLCPSSAFAIASRWRDRRFGSRNRILAHLVEHLTETGILAPELAAALFPLQADWSTSKLFSTIIEKSSTEGERQRRASFLYRYIQLDGQSFDSWCNIRDIANRFGIHLPNIDERVSHSTFRTEINKKSSSNSVYQTLSRPSPDWNEIFADVDVTSPQFLNVAKSRCRDMGHYSAETALYREAALRTPLGREKEFIQAVDDLPGFWLRELEYILEGIPQAWRNQKSTMNRLRELVKTKIAEHCMDVSVHRHYVHLPLELVERNVGIPVPELIAMSLEAIANQNSYLGADTLFNLACSLSKLLTVDDARQALDFLLTELETSMDDELGDGPWTGTLLPSSDIETSVAAYVWAGLASPERKYRWQATHVVRALCHLHCQGCLDRLMQMLMGSSPASHVDHHLVHYRLHATLFLLIGIARAALEAPDALKKYADALSQIASPDEQHVLIRGYAARALLAMSTMGVVDLDSTTISRLQTVNEPASKIDADKARKDYYKMCREVPQSRKTSLLFGIDMPQYWFDPLARRFSLLQSDLTARVEEVILKNLEFTEAQWDDDQRYARSSYSHRDTNHSHGSYPKFEDLKFYLSFHALMIVAGDLAASQPAMKEAGPYDNSDTFEYWLRRYEPTQENGQWLADRRDPEPLDYSDWSGDKKDDDWRWRVAKSDLIACLTSQDDMIVVSGDWTARMAARCQETSIDCALVTKSSARALMASQQMAEDFQWTQPFPDADDESEEEVEGFNLTGWVSGGPRNFGIDGEDPWCADIQFPARAPSDAICKLLNLGPSETGRQWHRTDGGTVAMESLTWSNAPDDDDRSESVNHGVLLKATRETLQELIIKTGEHLIFKVSINRTLRTSFQQEEDHSTKYPPSYILYLLLDENGKFTSI